MWSGFPFPHPEPVEGRGNGHTAPWFDRLTMRRGGIGNQGFPEPFILSLSKDELVEEPAPDLIRGRRARKEAALAYLSGTVSIRYKAARDLTLRASASATPVVLPEKWRPVFR
jgi:hypothetical protein